MKRYPRYAIFFDQDGHPMDEYVIECTSVATQFSSDYFRSFDIEGYAIDPATIPNGGYIRRALFKRETPRLPLIWKVIFNDPATIVIWADNTKTVIKCQEGDIFDPEKGLAMAMCKKMLGNKSNFNNEFRKWLEE